MKKDWKTYALRNLTSKIVDCEHKTAKRSEAGFASIRTPNIGKGFISLEGVNRVSDSVYHKFTKRAVPQYPDMIMAREAPLGNVGIVPKSEQVCLGQRTVLISADENIVNARFLCYRLNSDEIQAIMHARGGGATVPHLNVGEIRRLPVSIPPLPTQRKIASILSAYDDLIENNLRRIKLLEELGQQTYEEWFVRMRFPGHEGVEVDAGTRLPKGWERLPLKDLVRLVKNSVHPASLPEVVPYIGMEHMPRKSICLNSWGYSDTVDSLKTSFLKGDILFGKIRPYFHKVGIASIDGIASTDIIVVRPKSENVSSLALAVMSSGHFVDVATQTSNGTKMPRANWKVLKNYFLMKPDTEILARFNQIVSSSILIMDKLVSQNMQAREARNLLLPRLMSGKVDIEAI